MGTGVSDEWIKNACDRLSKTQVIKMVPLTAVCRVIGGEPVGYDEAIAGEFKPVSMGAKWGVAWDTVWFRFSGMVPAEWKGGEVVALIELGGPGSDSFGWEGLVWKDGAPVRALGGYRNDIPLFKQAAGDELVEILVEGAANLNAPRHRREPVGGVDLGGELLFDLRRADLALIDQNRIRLIRQWKFLINLMNSLGGDDPRHAILGVAMQRVASEADSHGWDALAKMQGFLNGAASSIGTDPLPHKVTAVGHCHIDTAWCWPVRESVRKCARSFSTALSYMEKYPEYVFCASQTLHYQWMRDKYPVIWERIKAAIARGQWEVLAGMWIEPDTIVPCGESLVRQIVMGKLWTREHLGVDVRILWLPDVFGYNAALPQIMAQSGFDGFFTQKLSWNKTNRLPHHTFWWEGLDGTRMLAHFPPADTYGGSATPGEVARATTRFLDHGRSGESLYAYGYGDGGGGPTCEMIESLRMMDTTGGLPEVKVGTVHGFFDRIRKNTDDLQVWTGELYLETHRGTYTTAGALKMGNRCGETALRQAEFALSLLRMLRPSKSSMRIGLPGEGTGNGQMLVDDALRQAWELLMLNQFHDILPGTSIPWVTTEAKRDHGRVAVLAGAVFGRCMDEVGGMMPVADSPSSLWCINASGFDVEGVMDTPAGAVWGRVPSWGWAPVCAHTVLPSGISPVRVSEADGSFIIGNGIIRAVIDKNGNIPSVFDVRTGREVMQAGQEANRLCLHMDIPNGSDAWDIDEQYRLMGEDLPAAQSVAVIEETPLRVKIRLVRVFGTSTLDQTIVIRAGSARIDFETRVEWREEHKMLRVYFPCGVHSGRASHGIQYGHIERPTYANTSWESARFETGGQRWVDISEHGYGIAVLDNGKFGRSVDGGVVGLSLLRSPRSPDPVMDIGDHVFTYSLFPHRGDLVGGRVVEEAARLNQPLLFKEWPKGDGTLDREVSWFRSAGMVLDWVKPAEKGDGIILRGYEASGGSCTAVVKTAITGVEAVPVDLLEQETGGVLPDEGNGWRVAVTPFAIRSVRVRSAGC